MKAKDLTYIALSAAMIVVCSWISIDLPVIQFTLQVFAVAFTAYFLGAKKAFFAVSAYLLLGAVGVPVFSRFNAGVGALAGPTGGFLVGFIPFTLLVAAISGLNKNNVVYEVIGGVIGHVTLYVFGIGWYVISSMAQKGVAFFDVLFSFALAMLPLFAIDVVKIVSAMFLARFLKKVLKYE